jgi:high affinity Mn2+ porin
LQRRFYRAECAGAAAARLRPERTYYAFKPTRFVTVSLDYQFVANPAYNRDRGPASFAGLRLHSEF